MDQEYGWSERQLDVLARYGALCTSCEVSVWTQRSPESHAPLCGACAASDVPPQELGPGPGVLETAQAILEAALDGTAALTAGDTETVAGCLKAIVTDAVHLYYVALLRAQERRL